MKQLMTVLAVLVDILNLLLAVLAVLAVFVMMMEMFNSMKVEMMEEVALTLGNAQQIEPHIAVPLAEQHEQRLIAMLNPIGIPLDKVNQSYNRMDGWMAKFLFDLETHLMI